MHHASIAQLRRLAGLLALLATPALFAQTPPQATPQAPQQVAETTMREISVSATRTERHIDEVPATVNVITSEDMEQRLTRDIKDLMRYEPGVDVPAGASSGSAFISSPNRPGNTGFNIRGIEGNRVQILLDGIRVPDGFSFGSFSGPSRDVVNLDMLSRVEILRGPASTLYGSDAIGGVVSYTTYNPADFLKRNEGSKHYAFLRAGYASADGSTLLNAGGAYDFGAAQGLLILTGRSGHETATMGTNAATNRTAFTQRTEANPSDYTNTGVLAKLVVKLSDEDRLRFTVDWRNQDNNFNALNTTGAITGTRYYSSLVGDDNARNQLVSADWDHRDLSAKWLNGVKLTAYGFRSDTTQASKAVLNANATGIVNRLRNLDFQYTQDTSGVNLQLDTTAKFWNAAHRFTYGFEYFTQKTSEQRNGTDANGPAFIPVPCLGPVGTSCAAAVEQYPTRDFPISTTKQAALYVQDEAQVGALTIIAGLRYDNYKLTPEPDIIFTSGNPGITPQNLTFNATTPKLSALYQFTDVWSGYGQFAKGFRAPPYNDVNIGFTNIAFGYTAVPNPNLKPETSTGIEIGTRARWNTGSFGLAWFDNRYSDFIDSQVQLTCPGNPACSPTVGITYQSINRAKVRIFGLESRADWLFAKNWTALGSIAWSRGDDQSADVPLNTINPLKLVTGVRWGEKTGALGAEAIMVAAAAKTRIDATQYPVGTQPFAPPGYAVFDMLGWWRPAKKTTINAGIFNLFDTKYWLWSNTRLLSASALNLDYFTQPGRNLSVSLKQEF